MNESDLLKAWEHNAQGWSTLIRENQIPSRNEVTNEAILQAVGPAAGRVLDLGCGEGWLTRALSELGWDCVGVDGVASLVEQARLQGDQLYVHSTYQDLVARLPAQKFELVLANFSLLGEESTALAVGAVQQFLKMSGRFLIQTLHPSVMEQPEASGWQREQWDWVEGMSLAASPWYYRSLDDWRELLEANSLRLLSVKEPQAKRYVSTGSGSTKAASVILECGH